MIAVKIVCFFCEQQYLDRAGKGFECVLVSNATDGYVPHFKQVSLEMITFAEANFVINPNFVLELIHAYRAYSALYAIRLPFLCH
jgi:hypothetical protein